MLSKDRRVRKSQEFSRIYRYGRSLGSGHLRLIFLPSREGVSRFGFVVSKKSTKIGEAAGKIARRNRMKRVLRDEARKHIQNLLRKVIAVVQVRDGAAKLKSEELREELRTLLRKAGLLRSLENR